MARMRRIGATLALAGVLCASLALTPAPLSAAPTDAIPQLREKVCDHLAQAIAFLEQKPQSALRDFLIAALRKAQERHCA